MTETEVLGKLSEIENAAQTVIRKTSEKKAELQKQSDQRTAEFDSRVDAESEKQLADVRASLEKSLDSQLSKLDEETRRATDFLDTHYAKELDARADEIVADILK